MVERNPICGKCGQEYGSDTRLDEALAHLRRLFEAGSDTIDGTESPCCHYCRGEGTYLSSSHLKIRHEPDCSYFAAARFLDQLSTPTADDAPSR